MAKNRRKTRLKLEVIPYVTKTEYTIKSKVIPVFDIQSDINFQVGYINMILELTTGRISFQENYVSLSFSR